MDEALFMLKSVFRAETHEELRYILEDPINITQPMVIAAFLMEEFAVDHNLHYIPWQHRRRQVSAVLNGGKLYGIEDVPNNIIYFALKHTGPPTSQLRFFLYLERIRKQYSIMRETFFTDNNKPMKITLKQCVLKTQIEYVYTLVHQPKFIRLAKKSIPCNATFTQLAKKIQSQIDVFDNRFPPFAQRQGTHQGPLACTELIDIILGCTTNISLLLTLLDVNTTWRHVASRRLQCLLLKKFPLLKFQNTIYSPFFQKFLSIHYALKEQVLCDRCGGKTYSRTKYLCYSCCFSYVVK